VYILFVKDWRRCKGSFEVLENFLTIVVPRELCEIFEELDNGSGLFGQFWKESRYGGQTAYEALYFFDVGGVAHIDYSFAFFRVGFNSALCEHEA